MFIFPPIYASEYVMYRFPRLQPFPKVEEQMLHMSTERVYTAVIFK